MAHFIRYDGDPLTPLNHDKEVFKQYITQVFFKELLGKRGSGKPIIIDDKKFKGKGVGDTSRYHFVPQYYGAGIYGQNSSIEGNEKTLDEFYVDIKIDQVAQAFRKKGKLTDIRVVWDIRKEFTTQLANWFRKETEVDMVDALTGYITDGVTRETDAGFAPVNGAGRCFRPDYVSNKFKTVVVDAAETSDTALLGSITADDIMNTKTLDELQVLAKTANSKYAMKPVRLKDGKEYYILVLHPKAAMQLRQDERWEKRALAMYNGTRALETDPIATGMMGVWEKIIVKEADHIRTAGNGTLNIARNLLLGADAGVMAYAQTLQYKEEEFDYGREMGVAADEIRGIRKLTFDGVDLNIAQVPCAI